MTHKERKPEDYENNTMELNKLSVSLISVLITVAGMLGGFCYQNGKYSNELKNIKEQQSIIKTDLTADIDALDEDKAEKAIVELIYKKIDDIQKSNEIDHKAMFDKLDRMIEKK
jgi:cell division protein FtsX